MRFLEQLKTEDLFDVQAKCPQARFLFDDKLMVEVAMKLVLLNLKNQN